MLNINYEKNDNKHLFKSLEKHGIYDIQNYIPLYKFYFKLSDQNYNKINLNHASRIVSLEENVEKNKFNCKILENEKERKIQTFIKFSPLIDPTKYMIGKYKQYSDEQIRKLPKLNNNTCISKILCEHNSAYVDSFFSYLSSMVLNHHKILHGIDFYGSFLGLKRNFIVNIFDDLEYLFESDFFPDNNDKLFKILHVDKIEFFNNTTRNNLKRLEIKGDEIKFQLDKIEELDFDGIFKTELHTNKLINIDELKLESEYEKNDLLNKPIRKDSDSSVSTKSSRCSSNSSNTDNSEIDSEEDDEDDGEDEEYHDDENESDYSDSDSDSDEDEVIDVDIYNFPIQMICLESLENTLDSFLDEDNELSIEEWRSCLFQVIMTLVIYQKMFDFTHNDLHTNNIMFKKTEKKYLYYRFNDKHYKVPTYGRIWKLIDFGRSIYKFKGKKICSDSFHKKGDAATQYNCEPFFNDKKPRLEPNRSFDICRLACSLFDYFVEDLEEEKVVLNPIVKMVRKWCMDDKKRNILYKTNGEERYPEFKLYKMIARTVHHCVPEEEIKDIIFSKYIVSRKKINKKQNIMNIDTLPSYK